MNEPRSDPIMQRLERLEQTLRWWKRGGGAALLLVSLVALLGAAGQPGANLVRATAFYLVDQTGQTRAALALGPGSSPALGLRDARGQLRAVLTLQPDGSPRFIFTDADEKVIWQAP
jgi:hypothetical protein